MNTNKYRGNCSRCYEPVNARQGVLNNRKLYCLACDYSNSREIIDKSRPRTDKPRRHFGKGWKRG